MSYRPYYPKRLAGFKTPSYARVGRPARAAAGRPGELPARVGDVRAGVRARDGGPRVRAELVARGVRCRVNAVAKATRAGGTRADASRRFVRATGSRHGRPVAADVPGRDFAPAGPNDEWAADVAHAPAIEGGLFPAVAADPFGRRGGGRATTATVTSRAGVGGLEVAASGRRPAAGLVAHSDRGSRYARGHYPAELSRLGMTGGTSGAGQCWGNAVVEGTFGPIRRESVPRETYAPRGEARSSPFGPADVSYDRARRHSTLGYVAPAEYERTRDQTLRP